MDRRSIGNAGLKGWRGKLADTVAPPVAKRSGLSEDQIRPAFGILFLVLAIVYVFSAIREIVTER